MGRMIWEDKFLYFKKQRPEELGWSLIRDHIPFRPMEQPKNNFISFQPNQRLQMHKFQISQDSTQIKLVIRSLEPQYPMLY